MSGYLERQEGSMNHATLAWVAGLALALGGAMASPDIQAHTFNSRGGVQAVEFHGGCHGGHHGHFHGCFGLYVGAPMF